MFDYESPYNRNVIVCVPTMMGQALFFIPAAVVMGVVMVAGIPLAVLSLPIQLSPYVSSGDVVRGYTDFVSVVGGSIIFLGGVLVGTPFLPLSYLAPEARCNPVPEPDPHGADSSAEEALE
jgi:hypothetical protein